MVVGKLMFPNLNNFPTFLLKLRAQSFITFYVAEDFCLPIFCVRLWNVAAFGAAVPEAAVNKNRG